MPKTVGAVYRGEFRGRGNFAGENFRGRTPNSRENGSKEWSLRWRIRCPSPKFPEIPREGSGDSALVANRFEEESIRFIAVFNLGGVTESRKKTFECHIIRWRNLERREHSTRVRTVVPIVKQADVPTSA